MQQFPHSGHIPAHQGPPASATPMEDYRRSAPPGLTPDGQYFVMPAELFNQMELPWQQQFRALAEHHRRTYAHAPWPTYRVIPTRSAVLTMLSEEQLAEVGVLCEYDDHDELVYRHSNTLEPIEEPENRTVHVSCLDPLTRNAPTGYAPPLSTPPQ